MNHEFDFKKLFVLDMANNHQGILSHGKNIITEAANAVEKSGLKNDGVRFGIKFQFSEKEDRKNYARLKNIWLMNNKVKIRRKFKLKKKVTKWIGYNI